MPCRSSFRALASCPRRKRCQLAVSTPAGWPPTPNEGGWIDGARATSAIRGPRRGTPGAATEAIAAGVSAETSGQPATALPGSGAIRRANDSHAASSTSVNRRARVAIALSTAQAAGRERGEIRGPPTVLLHAELMQVIPGENADVLFASQNGFLPRPVALHLGGGAFDAEVFGRQGEAIAVVEGDVQDARGPVQPDLGRNRHLLFQLAGFVDQHDRDPVAHRIDQTRLTADQLAGLPIVLQRPLGQWTDQDLQQAGIERGLMRWFGHAIS